MMEEREILCLVGTRRSGKSRKLLEIASRDHLKIAVPTRGAAYFLMHEADELGIPCPDIVPVEFFGKRGVGQKKVCIDDALHILERLLGCSVEVVTFDAEKFDMSKMTLLDVLAEWRRQRRRQRVGMLPQWPGGDA